MSTISSRIRQSRTSKNLTQQNLADLTGVSLKAVQNWETDATPRDPMLDKIAAALDVTKAYLRDGEPEQNVLSILNQAKVKIAKALNISDARIKLEVSFLG